jgi:hypothetical protein
MDRFPRLLTVSVELKPIHFLLCDASGESKGVSGRRRSRGSRSGGRRHVEGVRREALGREAATGIGWTFRGSDENADSAS